MKKAKKIIKPGRGRKCMGLEPKCSRLFTLDCGIFQEFKRHCKENNIKMSACVQALMHEYNVRNA